jgi:fibro-slime domain-containing protein
MKAMLPTKRTREHHAFARATSGIAAVMTLATVTACGGNHGSGFGENGSSNGGGGTLGSQSGGSLGGGGGGGGGGTVTDTDGGTGVITAVVRDFRFYDSTDSTTDPDFENPPYMFDGNGNPVTQMFSGPWDDRNIVTATLGSDKKPVYKNASGTTLTTHGKASFDKWYNDTSGTNIDRDYPLPLTKNSDGSFGYDSNVSGVPYNISGQSGDGFFPIDDGSPYQTAFGNQGKPHNYSFTVEIHTLFTYSGGETFNFRGDDDVFVYIDGKLVINLGGIHGPETASVTVDSLGLTVGQQYPLDFFSAERHVTGSNIEFTTTLQLVAVPPPK